MPVKKMLFALGALLVFALAWLRPVCTVSVNSIPLEGEWRLADVGPALDAARAAAAEAARGEITLPEVETSVRPALLPATGSRSELARRILEHTGGVELGWDVYVDGERAGRTDDLSVLGELLMAAIAESVPPECTRAGFDSDIVLREVFGAEGSATDAMELSRALRGSVRVVYSDAGGEAHYA